MTGARLRVRRGAVRFFRHLAPGLIFVAVAACKDGGGDDETDPDAFVSVDVRVDGGDDLAADPDSQGVQLCGTTSGAVLLWTDDRSGQPDAWVVASTDGGTTWPSAPVAVAASPVGASGFDLACSGNLAVVVWSDQRVGELQNGNLWIRTSSDGGATWSAARSIDPDADAEHISRAPSVGVADSEVVVAWATNLDGAYDIYARASHDGGESFGSAMRLDGGGAGTAFSSNPEVGLDGSGTVLVAWEDRRSGYVNVFTAHSTDNGSSFGADQRLDAGLADSYAPVIAVDSTDVVVAWHEGVGEEAYDVFLRHSGNGGATWDAASRVSGGEPGEIDAVAPRIAALDGQTHVVWFEEAQGGYAVMHLALQDGSPVSSAAMVDQAPAGAKAWHPTLAAGPAGLVVGWEDDRWSLGSPTNDLFYQLTEDGGATWQLDDLRLNSLEGGTATATELALALAGDQLIAAWVDTRNGSSDIYVTRLALGSATPTPDPDP